MRDYVWMCLFAIIKLHGLFTGLNDMKHRLLQIHTSKTLPSVATNTSTLGGNVFAATGAVWRVQWNAIFPHIIRFPMREVRLVYIFYRVFLVSCNTWVTVFAKSAHWIPRNSEPRIPQAKPVTQEDFHGREMFAKGILHSGDSHCTMCTSNKVSTDFAWGTLWLGDSHCTICTSWPPHT